MLSNPVQAYQSHAQSIEEAIKAFTGLTPGKMVMQNQDKHVVIIPLSKHPLSQQKRELNTAVMQTFLLWILKDIEERLKTMKGIREGSTRIEFIDTDTQLSRKIDKLLEDHEGNIKKALRYPGSQSIGMAAVSLAENSVSYEALAATLNKVRSFLGEMSVMKPDDDGFYLPPCLHENMGG